MTSSEIPVVSIGLPVYNGREYIESALASILHQDFEDFELIISDNASMDGTQEVLDDWASRDRRITVYKNETNIGGASNFNKVLDRARGKYFRWATHDDTVAPSMLAACVAALESADDSCVLVYPQTVIIDADGNQIKILNEQLILDSDDPATRLREFIRRHWYANPIYGLMRTSVVKEVGGIAEYNSGDLTMMAALALRGKFLEVPEPLFFRRMHENMSWKKAKTPEGFAKWFDPSRRWIVVFRTWRLWRELMAAVWRSPLNLTERVRATLVVVYAWPQREWLRLLKELGRVPIALARSFRERSA